MGMYAIGILPLLLFKNSTQADDVKRVAYADDFTGIGALENLRSWWDLVVNHGPNIGYFPKPSKSILIVKENLLEIATNLFEGTGVHITTDGNRHTYVENLVQKWIADLKTLSNVFKVNILM